MSATIIAVAGLLTTLTAAVAAPFLQGRVAVRTKLHEQRLAAYADAMTFVQYVESRLLDFTEEPELRSRRVPAPPDQDSITARVRLLAPTAAVSRWKEFTAAWDILAFNLQEIGPTGPTGEYEASPNDPDVVRVRDAAGALETELRRMPGWVSS